METLTSLVEVKFVSLKYIVIQTRLNELNTVRNGDFMNVEFSVIPTLLTFRKVNLKVAGTVRIDGSVVAVNVYLLKS